MLDTLGDDSDEMFEDIEELGTIVSLLREPNKNIKKEFEKIKNRKPNQLQHLLRTVIKQKQFKFLRYLIAIES